MDYTIQRLARLAGVTPRTLRYYDAIGLLAPARVSSNGYRIYGVAEVDRLQEILFFRELDLPLDEIRSILQDPAYRREEALHRHRAALLARRDRLDRILATLDASLETTKGERKMTDKEKFEGFKQKLIEDNEKTYGKEVRARYGDEAVDRSNRSLANMTEEDQANMEELTNRVLSTLLAAFATGDPEGPLAAEAADLHRQWLSFYWNGYSKEAHRGIVDMYVADARFTAYYDQHAPGLTAFLREAVLAYLSD